MSVTWAQTQQTKVNNNKTQEEADSRFWPGSVGKNEPQASVQHILFFNVNYFFQLFSFLLLF